MWIVWKDLFLSTLDKHAPIRTKRISTKKRSPWITHELIRKMHTRDYFKKRFVLTRNIEDWHKYKKARNDANSSIKRAKQAYFRSNLELNKADPRKAWRLINDLLSRQSGPTSISEIKLENQRLASGPDIAEAFNKHFTSVGPTLASEIHQDLSNDPCAHIPDTGHSFSFEPIAIAETTKLLRELDGSKATGLDKIPCKILKIAGDIISPSLTKIFNQSLSLGIFPDDWKVAKVNPTFKKGQRSDLQNYRPISIISGVAKVFEKAVFSQIYKYFNDYELLTNCQSGFRPQHSTQTALLETINSWAFNIDKGLVNGVIFIDLKKAFDTIDHGIIISKLAKYGFTQKPLTWFQSYLEARSQITYVNGYCSSSGLLRCGVPQGSILGPLLFLVYINDLPNSLDQGISRMYADDTSISVAVSHIPDLDLLLNNELRNVDAWLKTNKLSLNTAKTEFMTIGSRQKLSTQKRHTFNIHIQGKEIKKVHHTKSLGVHLDENLSWREHITDVSKKVSSGIGALKRTRSIIDLDTANKIYQALIEPYFDYCSLVWDSLGTNLAEKLQKLQNRAARVVSGLSLEEPSQNILDLLGWDKLHIRRTKQKAKLMFKTTKKMVPSYLHSIFSTSKTQYKTRDSENKLALPKPRTNYLKNSLAYSGAKLWNSLPSDLRKADNLHSFNRGLNSFALTK